MDFFDVNIYLDNYQNQSDMASCFLCLPWNPSLRASRHLDEISKQAIDHLKRQKVKSFSKYTWGGIKNGHLGHHISLGGNVTGEPYVIDRFVENIEHGVRNFLKIDSKLLVSSEEEERRIVALKVLLKNTDIKGKRMIKLPLSKRLTLYRSHTSNRMFLSIDIEMEPPVEAFFSQLKEMISENVKLLELVNHNIGFSSHVLISATDDPLTKISDQDYNVLKEGLNKIQYDTEDIEVCVSELMINRLNKEKSFTTISLI